ncbi:MFS transporter [Rouxiella sp. S1S-2]|uniref:MFS transporter n=1 Tax=Rouxiella sp. S1S-2 TaxID=2653856 RepID=UPI0012643DE6|nr:MFS transporter [Rouxiella sp. S1S-2]KAB7897375.1 MFS transporter [Rouxiella sp. S1S-2]
MNKTFPPAIYVLGFTLFAMTTSEYMVAGLITSMSTDLGVSIPKVGYLITLYSLGMVLGGPLLATFLVKLSNKAALLTITGIFLVAQAVATVSATYDLLAVARFATGLSSAAFFGFALMTAAKMVPPERFGVAASIVLGGMMIATVAGLPISAILDQYYGWRVSFALIIALTALAGMGIILIVPKFQAEARGSIKTELGSILNGSIWSAFITSFFVIAATFATFSYFVPYFENTVGFDSSSIPAILFAYGCFTIIGNILVGRLADNSPVKVVFIGSIVLVLALCGLYVFYDNKILVLISVMVLGLTGITLTPAMSSRVFKAAPNTSLINTLHTSVICLGVVVGSWGGGYAIDQGFGYRSPALMGIFLACLAIVTLLPVLRNHQEPQ